MRKVGLELKLCIVQNALLVSLLRFFGVFSTLAPLYAWDCVFVAESGESPCGHAYCDTVLCTLSQISQSLCPVQPL